MGLARILINILEYVTYRLPYFLLSFFKKSSASHVMIAIPKGAWIRLGPSSKAVKNDKRYRSHSATYKKRCIIGARSRIGNHLSLFFNLPLDRDRRVRIRGCATQMNECALKRLQAIPDLYTRTASLKAGKQKKKWYFLSMSKIRNTIFGLLVLIQGALIAVYCISLVVKALNILAPVKNGMQSFLEQIGNYRKQSYTKSGVLLLPR